MEFGPVSRADKRQVFGLAVILAVGAFILGPPVVEAAVQTVKIKASNGNAIEAKPIPDMGLLDAPGSRGALAVRTFAGGGGLLGAGDCTASTEPAQGPLSNRVTLSGGHVVSSVVVTGTGTVRITTDALGPVPLLNVVVNAEHPNEELDFGSGLSVTAPLHFTGIDGTACNFMVLGTGPGAGS